MNSNSKRFVIKLTACTVLAIKSSAIAAEVRGTLSFMTDYVSRGYSKSNGNPTVQGNLDYEHDSGFYTGVWVSHVDFGDHETSDQANVELIPYLGWSLPLAEDWRFDSYLSRYFYDGRLFGQNSDYNELNVLGHFRDLASLRVAWSENYYNRNHSALDYELTLRYPFTDTFEAAAGFGFSDTMKALQYSYLYWNAGVTWFFKYGSMDLRYVQAARSGHPLEDASSTPHFEPKGVNADVIFTLSLGF